MKAPNINETKKPEGMKLKPVIEILSISNANSLQVGSYCGEKC